MFHLKTKSTNPKSVESLVWLLYRPRVLRVCHFHYKTLHYALHCTPSVRASDQLLTSESAVHAFTLDNGSQ